MKANVEMANSFKSIARPTLEIRVDGNSKVGLGHLRRAKTLAAELCSFTNVRVIGLSSDACRLLGTHDTTSEETKLVIFDSPYPIDSQLLEAQARGQITVALDWFGKTIPDVNIAVYPHDEVRATREAYTGFEYILVRKEITLLPRSRPTGRANRVLIFLGGGDLLGQGHEASRRLRDQGLEVTLVQGPLAKDVETDAGYSVLVNPPELPQLLASCDWAVTNGGGCFFEALCVGKAAFVLPQSDAETKIARFAQERGAVLGIGLGSLRGFHPAELEPVAKSGAKLVDGRGAERISAIVRGLL